MCEVEPARYECSQHCLVDIVESYHVDLLCGFVVHRHHTLVKQYEDEDDNSVSTECPGRQHE